MINIVRFNEIFHSWSTKQNVQSFTEYLDLLLNKYKFSINSKTLFNMGMLDPSTQMEIMEDTFLQINEVDLPWIIEGALETCRQILKVEKVNILLLPLSPKQEFIISEMYGSAAYTINDNIFLLTIPINDKGRWTSQIKSLCFHEYCHIYRNTIINKSKQIRTLIESIIEEGFAESFVQYGLGVDYLGPWAKKQSKTTLLKYLSRMRANLSKKNPKDIYAFLNGDIYNDLPHWIGYALGYELIQYLLKTQDDNLLELMTLDCFEILNKIDWQEFESYLKRGDRD
ncbi:hypothetical protein GCM10008915_48810 [Bifidobacterium pullorum subsp. gallinarum]